MTLLTVHQRVDTHITGIVESGRIPGIQYVVVDSHDVRYEYYGGRRDVSSDDPVTSDTTFMSSSTTKTLTAAAVLQLKGRNMIDLAESLSMYFPSHPYGHDIKINHLLNQTSGVPNPLPLKWLHLVEDHESFDADKALQDVLKRHSKLRFIPGSRYAYSNISYWLLGKVIEHVSGMLYDDYMRKNIIGPLGISNKDLDFQIVNIDNHACGHLRRFSPLGLLIPFMMSKEIFSEKAENRLRFRPVYMDGAPYGGLIGTALAFSKFLQDQLSPNSILFNDKTKDLFYSEQIDSRKHLIETTLGWHRGKLLGVEYFGKPGGGPGFQSNMRIYPSKGIATVWLANETGVSEGPIHKLTDNMDKYFL
jgi:D-alanyl-D-alanine carboxypeptidase